MNKKKKFGFPHIFVCFSFLLTFVGFIGTIVVNSTIISVNAELEKKNQYELFGYYDYCIQTLKDSDKYTIADYPSFAVFVSFLLTGSCFGIFTLIGTKWSNYEWDWSK